MFRKFSSLFLISLIFNLNMVVPAVSYAAAEETCSCHLNNADHQCHCEEGCKSCGMHKSRGQEPGARDQLKLKTQNLKLKTEIKGMTCSTSPQNDSFVLPILAIPFTVPDFYAIAPIVQVSSLPILIENPLYGVTVTPSEKPPAV